MADKPNPMDTAPKDGTMVHLLVDYRPEDADHPLEDALIAWTIGFNNLSNTGEDVWQFVGWSWTQDCFTDGLGTPLGWFPINIPTIKDTKDFQWDDYTIGNDQ